MGLDFSLGLAKALALETVVELAPVAKQLQATEPLLCLPAAFSQMPTSGT